MSTRDSRAKTINPTLQHAPVGNPIEVSFLISSSFDVIEFRSNDHSSNPTQPFSLGLIQIQSHSAKGLYEVSPKV